MSGYQFIMPPKRWAEIDMLALSLREEFGLESVARLPIVELMELVMSNKLNWFEFDVLSDSEMNGNEGQTCQQGKFIHIHEEVYMKACQGDPRSRFTLAHELGHWAMHTNVPLARPIPGEKIEAFRCSEKQADQFAGALLMPAHFFYSIDDEQSVIDRHGVSYTAAQIRLNYLRKKGLFIQ